MHRVSVRAAVTLGREGARVCGAPLTAQLLRLPAQLSLRAHYWFLIRTSGCYVTPQPPPALPLRGGQSAGPLGRLQDLQSAGPVDEWLAGRLCRFPEAFRDVLFGPLMYKYRDIIWKSAIFLFHNFSDFCIALWCLCRNILLELEEKSKIIEVVCMHAYAHNYIPRVWDILEIQNILFSPISIHSPFK